MGFEPCVATSGATLTGHKSTDSDEFEGRLTGDSLIFLKDLPECPIEVTTSGHLAGGPRMYLKNGERRSFMVGDEMRTRLIEDCDPRVANVPIDDV